jgi:hypothetical protein
MNDAVGVGIGGLEGTKQAVFLSACAPHARAGLFPTGSNPTGPKRRTGQTYARLVLFLSEPAGLKGLRRQALPPAHGNPAVVVWSAGISLKHSQACRQTARAVALLRKPGAAALPSLPVVRGLMGAFQPSFTLK